jgi:hypothetical protein
MQRIKFQRSDAALAILWAASMAGNAALDRFLGTAAAATQALAVLSFLSFLALIAGFIARQVAGALKAGKEAAAAVKKVAGGEDPLGMARDAAESGLMGAGVDPLVFEIMHEARDRGENPLRALERAGERGIVDLSTGHDSNALIKSPKACKATALPAIGLVLAFIGFAAAWRLTGIGACAVLSVVAFAMVFVVIIAGVVADRRATANGGEED